MFAPTHHPAMKHAGPVRRELAARTVFNVLGPLTNPAGARAQVVGVYSPELVPEIADVLVAARRAPRVRRARRRRHRRALAGRPEPRLRGRRRAAVREYEIDPLDLGIPRCDPAELRGGDPAENARDIRDVFDGRATAAAARRSCSTPPARSPPPVTPPTCARASSSRARRSTPAPPARLDALIAFSQRRAMSSRRRVHGGSLRDLLRSRSVPGTSRVHGSGMRFRDALGAPGFGAIAEFKRRSPSAGDLRPGADVAEVARGYERAGARAMSVLVDERFAGTWDDLRAARAATTLPLLAKGFFSTRERPRDGARGRRRRGAPAPARPRRRAACAALMREARRARPRHARRGARRRRARARRALDAPVIGVNARDLSTFEIDRRAQLALAGAGAARPHRDRRERRSRRARRAPPPSSPARTRCSSARR